MITDPKEKSQMIKAYTLLYGGAIVAFALVILIMR